MHICEYLYRMTREGKERGGKEGEGKEEGRRGKGRRREGGGGEEGGEKGKRKGERKKEDGRERRFCMTRMHGHNHHALTVRLIRST